MADLAKRYGNLSNGVKDIKKHRWFKHELDWDKIVKREITPPYIPEIKDAGDTSNYSEYPDSPELPEAIPAKKDPFLNW